MELKEIGQTRTSEEIEELLNKSELPYIPITYYNYDVFFIPIGDTKEEQVCQGISVTKCNKDCCRVYPHEILYIAIEDRKSVLYLIDGRVETNYHLDYWENILDANNFAKPHASYIVNLNYVVEITKDSVKVKHKDAEHSVYTSSRKIGAFKKTFMNFKG